MFKEYITRIATKIERAKTCQSLRQERVVRDVKHELTCKDVKILPGIFLGRGLHGYYSNGTIYVRAGLNPIMTRMVLFHEDKHYQQKLKDDYIFVEYHRVEDSKFNYWKQWCEEDARRYAYVKTMRYLRQHPKATPLKLKVIHTIAHPFGWVMRELGYRF